MEKAETRKTENQKPEVRTAAILVLVRERLEHEYDTVTNTGMKKKDFTHFRRNYY
jgi:hypothetical protein